MGSVRESSPRKGSKNGSPRTSVQESRNLQLVETKPPWNWAFWSRARPTASGPLSSTTGALYPVKEKRNNSESSLSRQNSSKGQQAQNRIEPADKAEALLKPLLATLGPGAMVEATVYTREVETKIPKDADPTMVEKILEGAFGQFREGKIFPQTLEAPGQLSRRSSEEKNQSQEDKLVVGDFAKPDIHFPAVGGEELSKGKAVESSNDGTYRIEESSDNEVPLLELPAWKTTEVRGNNMTMRTQYLSAKAVNKEKLIQDAEKESLTKNRNTNQREDETEAEIIRQRRSKIGQLADRVEMLMEKQAELGAPDPRLKSQIEHEALMQLLKGQEIILKNHDKSLAENLRMKEELQKKQVAINGYENKLQALETEILRHQEETEEVETYKQEIEHQKALRIEMEKQIGILSAPTPALNDMAKQGAMLLRRLQEERVRRGKAEGKVRSLTRQVTKLTSATSDTKAVGDSAHVPDDAPGSSDLPENAPSTSATKNDDFDEYDLVIDNYLFSPTKREEWMGKEGILLKGQDGTIDMNKVVQLVDSFHTLQKRYANLQKRFKQQDGGPVHSAPGDSEVLSVKALNQKCQALLFEVDELRKSREAMEAHIEKLKQIHFAGQQASSSRGSMLENILKEEESRRVAEETKVQILSEQVKELQELQGSSDGVHTRSEHLPLQEQALNIGVFAMAQLIMLSYGFGAWLEMLLIPLFGRFPT